MFLMIRVHMSVCMLLCVYMYKLVDWDTDLAHVYIKAMEQFTWDKMSFMIFLPTGRFFSLLN